jgi:hypothetical protein
MGGHSTTVASGSMSNAAHNNGSDSSGVCCFPYLTGNAVFAACSSAGLGFYHHVDLQHVLQQERYVGMDSGAPRVSVLNAKALGFSGTLDATQVWLLPPAFGGSGCET